MNRSARSRMSGQRFGRAALALSLSFGTIAGFGGYAAMAEGAPSRKAEHQIALNTAPLPPQTAASETRRAPRVVRIEGFANCAIVSQKRDGTTSCQRSM